MMRWVRMVLFVGNWYCYCGVINFISFSSVLYWIFESLKECPLSSQTTNPQRYHMSLGFKKGQDDSHFYETSCSFLADRASFHMLIHYQPVLKAKEMNLWHVTLPPPSFFKARFLYTRSGMPCEVHYDGILPLSQICFSLCITLGDNYSDVCNTLRGTYVSARIFYHGFSYYRHVL